MQPYCKLKGKDKCPRCGRPATTFEIVSTNPPTGRLMFTCCGWDRYIIKNDHGKWEFEEDKRKRVEVEYICKKCEKPFTLSCEPKMKDTPKICEACVILQNQEWNRNRNANTNNENTKKETSNSPWRLFKYYLKE